MRLRPKHVEARRKTTNGRLEEGPPQPTAHPGRGDDIDILQPQAGTVETVRERKRREMLRMPLSIEALASSRTKAGNTSLSDPDA